MLRVAHGYGLLRLLLFPHPRHLGLLRSSDCTSHGRCHHGFSLPPYQLLCVLRVYSTTGGAVLVVNALPLL